MSGMETGIFLCGQVNFTAPGPLRQVIGCHYIQFHKTVGHFMAAMSAAWNNVKIKGEATWHCSSAQAWHGFYGICGRQLFWDGLGENIVICAGSLNGDSGMALEGHMFCADKGDYYRINDGPPQAEADNPALITQFYMGAVVQ